MSRKLLIQSVLSTIESNQNVKLTQRAAGEIVDSVFNTITNQLQTTGIAKTVLGTFRVVERKARNARNPRTGESILVPAKKGLRYTPTKQMKDETQNFTLP